MAKKRFRILVGCNYGARDVHHAPGEIVDNIPAAVLATWLDEGVIELVPDEST